MTYHHLTSSSYLAALAALLLSTSSPLNQEQGRWFVESFAVVPSRQPSMTTPIIIQERHSYHHNQGWMLFSTSTAEAEASTVLPAAEEKLEDEDSTTTTDDDKQQGDSDSYYSSLSPIQLKEQLIDIIPKMTGKEEELRAVESLVNAMESKYQPAQTLDFQNLLMQGEWQLIFSTNLLANPPNRMKFKLCKLLQSIECHGLEGNLTNVAKWDFAESGEEGNFDATGTFNVQCQYTINQGARMVVDLNEHLLLPARGSVIPSNVPELVGMLHRAMPKELFDPSNHAIDTTYVDGDFRIVRYTGPRLEGVRDIFVRQGTIELDPVTTTTARSASSGGEPSPSETTEEDDDYDALF